MIECIFTIDYEIYGNGKGSLSELVFEPAEKLKALFNRFGAKFVTFTEVAELEVIESYGTDPAIPHVKRQIRELFGEGFEIGLHLHPQWYNAQNRDGKWQLDNSEYNLCALKGERIAQIIDRSITYLRNVLGVADYTPFSFRAGNWLFQPAETAAKVLAERGIRVDSSVFKGGLQHQYKLDYRPAERNGYFWKFKNDVNVADPCGTLLEFPIHTQMVPFWKMGTGKRLGMQQRGPGKSKQSGTSLDRLRDFLRFRYPLKFDFCRMTTAEFTGMLDKIIREDLKDPSAYRPLVAIGHTKDLFDFETVEAFLALLSEKRIAVSQFKKVYEKCVVVNG
jgi:hypothetical protein